MFSFSVPSFRLVSWIVILCILALSAHGFQNRKAFSRMAHQRWLPTVHGSLFAAGRGFGKEEKKTRSSSAVDTIYPPMSQSEIAKWLSHIPVYAVTDQDGNAQTLQLDNQSVLYFFLSPIMAEAFMNQLMDAQSNSESYACPNSKEN